MVLYVRMLLVHDLFVLDASRCQNAVSSDDLQSWDGVLSLATFLHLLRGSLYSAFNAATALAESPTHQNRETMI